MRRKLWPTAERTTLAASPARPLRKQRPRWPSAFRCPARTIVSTAAAEIPAVQKQLRELHSAAQRFLDEHADPTDGKTATAFCKDCTAADPAQIIRNLVTRDSRVLQLRSSDIVPGSAFVGRPQVGDIDEDAVGPGAKNVSRIPVPEGVSPRMQNLYLLELDLNHRLGTYLNPLPNQEAA